MQRWLMVLSAWALVSIAMACQASDLMMEPSSDHLELERVSGLSVVEARQSMIVSAGG